MKLFCSKCGAPYTGGFICEKCGSRFSDKEISAFNQEQSIIENQKAESANQKAESAQKKNKTVRIVIIVAAVFFILNILAVIAAFLVPAFIGYNVKKKAAQEEFMHTGQSQHESLYGEDDSAEEVRGAEKEEWLKEYGTYPAGTYEVGTDIPEGEYVVVSSDSGYGDFYFGTYSKSDCSDDSELYGGWFQGNMYVVLKEGMFVNFSHAVMYDNEKNDFVIGENQTGAMYKVGRDIEPGKYQAVPTSDQYGIEYAVYSSIDSIIPVEKESSYCESSIESPLVFELNEGEYISIKFAKLEKAE